MAFTLQDLVRNTVVDASTTLMDSGSIEFLTSASLVVATVFFDASSFGTSSLGTATANPIPNDESTGAGTVTQFRIKNLAGNILSSGSVSVIGGGGDFELSEVDFNTGDRLVINSLTYTQPAVGA